MDNRNLILACVLSLVVLLGWGAMFPAPEPVENTTVNRDITPEQQTSHTPAISNTAATTKTQDQFTPSMRAAPSDAIIASISNSKMHLDVNEKGWLVHANLNDYKQSLEQDSLDVAVLEQGERHGLYISSGVLKETPSVFKLIKKTTTSMTIQTELSSGQIWTRDIHLNDNQYVIDVFDRISQGGTVQLFSQIVEKYPNKDLSNFQEFVGPLGFINKTLTEVDYSDLDEQGQRLLGVGGWTGIGSRYFIAAIIGQQEHEYRYYFKGDGRTYQAGLISDAAMDGKDATFAARYYVGPKSIPIMEKLGVELERSVDFGWFAAIAKPMHIFLLWLFENVVNNYGWCIILLVICIKILFFYPTKKSYESMAGMRKLQPEMERLKTRYGDDRQKMGQEVMALYKKHKVNPLSGCLPILIQIPVFFALYKTLLMSIEMRHAPFIGWIHDMSVQDPYFVLPLVMGLSMFIQQRLNPQPTDPIQAKVMQFLPVLFTALFLFFPAGLVLYWVVNNILSIIQQWYVLKAKQAL